MSVPVEFNTVFARVRNTLKRYGKTAVAVDSGLGPLIVCEVETRDKGKVKLDLEKLARELGCMEDCEEKGGEWAANEKENVA